MIYLSAILLAIIPVINFIILYLVCKSQNKIRELKNIYAITILDWIFVPFNFLIPYAINITEKTLILFATVLILTIIPIILLHKAWRGISKKPDETKLFITNNGLTIQGLLHLIFMVIQTSLVITLILTPSIKPYYTYALLCILLYLIGYITVIILVRRVKLVSKKEQPLIILGIILIVIRMLINY